jgi:hypothetical protein
MRHAITYQVPFTWPVCCERFAQSVRPTSQKVKIVERFQKVCLGQHDSRWVSPPDFHFLGFCHHSEGAIFHHHPPQQLHTL